MELNLKQAAEELLKIADDIEKEAAEVTQFVCEKCNHTATLASINGKRTEAAKVANRKVSSTISVNDTVSCPACGGNMTYHATEASQQFYFDPEKSAAEEGTEDPDATKPDAKDKKPVEAMDYDK